MGAIWQPKRMVVLVIGLSLLLLWLFLLRPFGENAPMGYLVVSGASMEPTLYSGDLVFVRRQTEYRSGDVVGFWVPEGLVIHRIVGGSAEAGFITQGDNRTAPDRWYPVSEQMLGRLWVRIPNVGKAVSRLRQPLVFAALATGGAAIAFPPKKRKQRRAQIGSFFVRVLNPLGESSVLVSVFVLAGTITILLGAMAYISFTNPLQVTEAVEQPLLTHSSTFDYTVHMEPSTLDPDGTLGPIGPLSNEDTAEAVPVSVFTRLATRLELNFEYALDVPSGSSVEGEFAPYVRIDAGDAWTKTLALEPATRFTGSRVARVVEVDFDQVQTLIETIEIETGFQAGSYTIAVVPEVHVQGQIGSETFSDRYSPEFQMQLDRARIVMESELARDETRNEIEQVARDNTIPVLGQMVSVRLARWTSLPLAIIGLATAGLILMVGFFGFGQAEALQIQARYGSMILSVKRADLPEGGRTIDVESMKDLARLAQQNGRNILHMRLGRTAHMYFVQEGDVTYKYLVPGPQTES